MNTLTFIRKVTLTDLTPDDLLHNYSNAVKYLLHVPSAMVQELAEELHELSECVNYRTYVRYRDHSIVFDNSPLSPLHPSQDGSRVCCDLYAADDDDADPVVINTIEQLYAYLVFVYK